jgi:hypothetical protein
MKYRVNAKVVSPRGRELGRVTYLVKAKNRAGALAKLRQMFSATKPKKLSTKKNVDQGFWDSRGFHPIRASADYNAGRAGEGLSRRRVASAKRTTTRLRKGH